MGGRSERGLINVLPNVVLIQNARALKNQLNRAVSTTGQKGLTSTPIASIALPMRSNITSALLVLFSFSAICYSSSPRGRVAVWHSNQPIMVEVPLETSSPTLENELIHFPSIPVGLTPDPSGCYCFLPTDERFAYVQAFYYATEQLSHYNNLLRSIGASPLTHLPIRIKKIDEGVWPHGGTSTVQYL